MAICMLHEAVCRQRPELLPTVYYMMLCEDRNIKCTIVCYKKMCVDRDLNCGQQYVT